NSTFLETCYLLIYGELPTNQELTDFRNLFSQQYPLPKDMLNFFEGYPQNGHPMGLLSAMICSLSGYYPHIIKTPTSGSDFQLIAAEILAKVSTISAYTYRRSMGMSFMPPSKDLDYIPNFLHMMFSTNEKSYQLKDSIVRAIRTLLILHADHEQNCSTSAVRLVGSSWANLFASVSAGVSALWGPLHGGANQKVVEMLQAMYDEGGNVHKFIEKAKDADDQFRLMGFGHRVYKNFDPRATIIKQRCYELFDDLGIDDPLLEIAVKLEEIVLKDEYFIERKLYPNVDFYSGLIYKAIKIPVSMFPVMFAIGRMPGWIAHWLEMSNDPKFRIGRPRQIYMGKNQRDYVPIDQR
ncbi:MAG: citrate (Si)-synthase, partial [Candidatus Omnitrophica bacterium]|nr:citrate (Si)-synthase [Candidatus Omnitrophota bacterium]